MFMGLFCLCGFFAPFGLFINVFLCFFNVFSKVHAFFSFVVCPSLHFSLTKNLCFALQHNVTNRTYAEGFAWVARVRNNTTPLHRDKRNRKWVQTKRINGATKRIAPRESITGTPTSTSTKCMAKGLGLPFK